MFGKRDEAGSLPGLPTLPQSQVLDLGQQVKPELNLPARVGFQFLHEFAYGRGRTARAEYLLYLGFLVVLFSPALLIDRANDNLVFTTILAAAVLIPTMAFTTRRLHDIGRRGWLMWLPVVQLLFAIKAVSLAMPGYLTARLGWSDDLGALTQALKDDRLAWLLSGIFMGAASAISFMMVGALLLGRSQPDANRWGAPD